MTNFSIYQKIDALNKIFFSEAKDILEKYSKNTTIDYTKRISELISKKNNLLEGNTPVRIVIAGEFSSGKSSFINSLIGESIIPVGTQPMTLAPSIFTYGENISINIEFNNGSFKKISLEEFNKIKHSEKESLNYDYNSIKLIHFKYPYSKLSEINIIDTPGFNTTTQKEDDNKTKKIIFEKSDIVLWLFDISYGSIKDSELEILNDIRNYLKEKNIKIIGVLNKVDLKGKPESDRVKTIIDEIKKRINFEIEIIPYSSKKVLESNKNYIFNEIKLEISKIIKEKKDCEIKFSTKNDIIIKQNENIILRKTIYDDDSWINPLIKIENKLKDIQLESSEILEKSLYYEFNNLRNLIIKTIKEISKEKDSFIKNNRDFFDNINYKIRKYREYLPEKYYNQKNYFESEIKKFLNYNIQDFFIIKEITIEKKEPKKENNIWNNSYLSNYMNIINTVYNNDSMKKLSEPQEKIKKIYFTGKDNINNLKSIFSNINKLILEERNNVSQYLSDLKKYIDISFFYNLTDKILTKTYDLLVNISIDNFITFGNYLNDKKYSGDYYSLSSNLFDKIAINKIFDNLLKDLNLIYSILEELLLKEKNNYQINILNNDKNHDLLYLIEKIKNI